MSVMHQDERPNFFVKRLKMKIFDDPDDLHHPAIIWRGTRIDQPLADRVALPADHPCSRFVQKDTRRIRRKIAGETAPFHDRYLHRRREIFVDTQRPYEIRLLPRRPFGCICRIAERIARHVAGCRDTHDPTVSQQLLSERLKLLSNRVGPMQDDQLSRVEAQSLVLHVMKLIENHDRPGHQHDRNQKLKHDQSASEPSSASGAKLALQHFAGREG